MNFLAFKTTLDDVPGESSSRENGNLLNNTFSLKYEDYINVLTCYKEKSNKMFRYG